ncbi:LysM peptidoglycan-binding domain-containing protein [Sphingomonas hylomeconis]|uniref:LysM peptidoglycan-binding domain-containing protein n=1 Tax=Sphingomonas hylomeconis TaxID=1395958 RepID=A0ABV7SW97_9SPHN|nr:LysM peptidoglycan-binding domain-containing protein [Sphingomonas hylomeconis]
MSGRKSVKLAVVAAGALSLAACSGGTPHLKAVAPPPAASSAGEAEAIATLLDQGQEGAARKRLKALLKRDPMNPSARLLNDSLDRDPKELLGPDSYPYVTRPGDTIVGLAQRFLGNRLKAYQLGRYNGLKAPVVLTPGQVLRIPGEAPRPEPVRRPDPVRATPAPAKPKPAAARPAAPAPAKPVANPVAARAARTAGLAALNQGNVQRAVGLLRRAAALDPGNALIARDLARAQRIAATVKARQ